jgi:hypothetical protein
VELLGQFTLGRQFVAWLENAERQLLADTLADLLERAARVDRAKIRRRRRSGGPMVRTSLAPNRRGLLGAAGRI